MSISKTRSFVPKILPPGEFSRALRAVVSQFSSNADSLTFDLSRTLADGSNKQNNDASYADLEEICNLTADFWMLNTSFENIGGERIYFAFHPESDHMRVHVDCDDGENVGKVFDLIATELELEEWEEPEKSPESDETHQLYRDALLELFQRLETIEQFVKGLRKPLRCFLSYRFGSDTEESALRVQRFLGLLDVDVITGATYQPRRVSEKVMDMLGDQSLNFVVLIVSAKGESMWTRDEIAVARSKEIPVIPLVEEGSDFTPGVFGDLEYISFASDHIGDTFIPLLEAVKFIRLGSSESNITAEEEEDS